MDGGGRSEGGAGRESRFWDRLAGRYSRQPIADQKAYETKLAITREYLRPDMRVLEFGCGTGSTALLHAPFVHHIEAMDFSGQMLAIAREKARAQGIENVSFTRADIETLNAPEAAYGAVLGMSVLHLLNDRRAAIAKVFCMLAPGGVFISSTACLGDTMRAIKLVAPIGKALGLLPQLDVMTHAELTASLQDAGFEIAHEWQPGKGKAVFIVARKPG